MSFLETLNWVWPAIGLAFLLGVVVARWLFRKISNRSGQKVNSEYFKGLNFLLNEETDKAIEVFIKALEVDSETVELHLALGGLFRRKGQVDRATRIHQNLVARPTLTDDQRMQAVYELAQDYYKAGWLDRAENLFKELMGSDAYRAMAINGLCQIYQQEKEWQQAVDVLRRHKRGERNQYAKQVAHYFCELAQSAIDLNDFEQARKYLSNARSEDQSIARVNLLRGDLNFESGNFPKAIQCWQSLIANHPKLAQLVVAKMIMCYQEMGDERGLKQYLLDVSALPKDDETFDVWRESLVSALGQEQATAHIFAQVERQGLSGPAASFLAEVADSNRLSDSFRATLLTNLLAREKESKIEYTCVGCGFDTRAMYWFCPNCGEWESFR